MWLKQYLACAALFQATSVTEKVQPCQKVTAVKHCISQLEITSPHENLSSVGCALKDISWGRIALK